MSQMDRRYKCMNPVQTQILLSGTLSGRRSEPIPAQSVQREPRERDPWTGRVSGPPSVMRAEGPHRLPEPSWDGDWRGPSARVHGVATGSRPALGPSARRRTGLVLARTFGPQGGSSVNHLNLRSFSEKTPFKLRSGVQDLNLRVFSRDGVAGLNADSLIAEIDEKKGGRK